MRGDILIEKQDVSRGNPDAVGETQQDPMEKGLSRLFGDDICANDEDDQPKRRFYIRRNEKDRGQTHGQSKKREQQDELPVHTVRERRRWFSAAVDSTICLRFRILKSLCARK